MGQRDDRPVVTSAPVAAFFRCFCRIMLASDATRVDATSWHLTQDCPVTTVLACGVRSVTAIAVPLYPDRPPLRRPPRAGRGMLHPMQLRALGRRGKGVPEGVRLHVLSHPDRGKGRECQASGSASRQDEAPAPLTW